MTDQRVLKRYANRRLYDTHISQYITLSDVKQLLLSYAPFVVIDSKTGENITRSVLLQLILEEESCAGTPFFSVEMLAEMIRMYGQTTQVAFSRYLEQSAGVFFRTCQGLCKQMEQSHTTWMPKLPGNVSSGAGWPSANAEIIQEYLSYQQKLMHQLVHCFNTDKSTNL